MSETSHMELSPSQRKALNDALDRVREAQHLTSDVALAVYLGVSPKLIWNWRYGRVGRLNHILANLLLPEPELVAV